MACVVSSGGRANVSPGLPPGVPGESFMVSFTALTDDIPAA